MYPRSNAQHGQVFCYKYKQCSVSAKPKNHSCSQRNDRPTEPVWETGILEAWKLQVREEPQSRFTLKEQHQLSKQQGQYMHQTLSFSYTTTPPALLMAYHSGWKGNYWRILLFWRQIMENVCKKTPLLYFRFSFQSSMVFPLIHEKNIYLPSLQHFCAEAFFLRWCDILSHLVHLTLLSS